MRLLHIADVHIGVENYGRIDSHTGLHQRLLDFEAALEFAVNTALNEQVDAVLFAGDAFKNHNPTPTHQMVFSRQMVRLSAAGIPVIMVVGNHDNPVAFGKLSALEAFRVFSVPNVWVATRPELIRVDTKSGPLQIAALPWPARSMLLTQEDYKNLPDSELTKHIEQLYSTVIAGLAEQIDPAVPAVALGHLTAAAATFSGSERTATIGSDPVFMTSTLANPAFDYVALGHIHRFQDINEGGSPPVVYSGSIERIDFGEEHEEKGFVLVDLTERGGLRLADYRFVAVPSRKIVTIEVDCTITEDPNVPMLEAIETTGLQEAIVRVVYTIRPEQEPSLDLAKVRRALEPAHYVQGLIKNPIRSQRLHRASISENTGWKSALEAYIANRPDLQELRDDLVEYAIRLEKELERGADS